MTFFLLLHSFSFLVALSSISIVQSRYLSSVINAAVLVSSKDEESPPISPHFAVAAVDLRRRETQSCLLCSTIGFDTSARGRRLFEYLFDGTRLGDNVVPLRLPIGETSLLSCVTKSGTAPVAIGFLDVGMTDGPLLAALTSYMEGAVLMPEENAKYMTDGTYPQLVVVSMDKFSSEKLVSEAWSLVPNSYKDLRREYKLENYIKIKFVELHGGGSDSGDGSESTSLAFQSVRDAVAETMSMQQENKYEDGSGAMAANSRQPSLMTGLKAAQMLTLVSRMQSAVRKENVVNIEDVGAMEACNHLVESYLSDLTMKLRNIGNDGGGGSGGNTGTSTVMTIESLTEVVSAALEENYKSFVDVFAEYGTSRAIKGAANRARIGTLTALNPLFKNMLNSCISTAVETFELAMRKIPPNSLFIKGMKNLADNTQRACENQVASLQKEFRDLLTKTTHGSTGGGLFSSSLSSSKLSSESVDSALVAVGALKRLNEILSNLCLERERSLFVQGIYNPYIRTYPFPPLHVNLNYLLNPRAAVYSISYNKLYDEHKDGLAINRADSLHIPGVTQIPFDPNQQPVPKENKPWYKVLIDIYSS